jgi:CRISPR-associated endonuclease Cas1
MLATITETIPDPNGPLVLIGEGVSLRVESGQLRIEDGMHRSERRVFRLERATTKLTRLVVLMRSGWLSFDALEWCSALGIQVVLIDRDGNVSVANSDGARFHDARLRRAQALAAPRSDRRTPADCSEQGVAVARYLLSLKCQGQQANLLRLGYDTPEIQREVTRVEQAANLQQCHYGESRLAEIYWSCWSVLPLRWQERKNGRRSHVPEHWRTVGLRESPKTGKPRGAVTPAHAILNYLYTLAEVETTIALHAVGLDPALGIVHADLVKRDSMSLDVLEAIRPAVDGYVLDFLDERTFSFSDVAELPSGEVRLSTALRQELTATLPQWRTAVAPVAEHVANLLRPETRTGRRIARTPLTNRNIRASQEKIRERRLVNVPKVLPRDPSEIPSDWSAIYPLIREAQTERLVAVTGLSHRYIRRVKTGEKRPAPQHWYALYKAATAGAQVAELASTNPTVATVEAPRPPAVQEAALSWGKVFPHVQATPTGRLAKATGLTDDYIRKIKRGELVPHRRHWTTLLQSPRLAVEEGSG